MLFLKKLLFLCFILPINLLAINGHIKTDLSITDKSWDFLPPVINSFDYSETLSSEILLLKNNFGLRHKQSNFELNLIRPIQPKIVNLKASSTLNELIYTINSSNAVSLSYKKQDADQQRFDCYTFSSLTIGYCEDARISISNTKEKYKSLNNSTLMSINGSNEEIKINYFKAVESIFMDEFKIYISSSKNSFDWLSPIEELQTGFIANLSFNGVKIGSLVAQEINRLPQRERFTLNKIGIYIQNNISMNSYLEYFYNLDFVFVKSKNYIKFNSIPKQNIKFETGLKFLLPNSISLSVFGTLYQNNLFGYEDISFNQRSENHFDKRFGSLNLQIKYVF